VKRTGRRTRDQARAPGDGRRSSTGWRAGRMLTTALGPGACSWSFAGSCSSARRARRSARRATRAGWAGGRRHGGAALAARPLAPCRCPSGTLRHTQTGRAPYRCL